MKILLVSVLFVSVTFANRVDLQDLVEQGSSETNSIERLDESVEVEPISENFLTEEQEVQPLKRSKKSYLTQPPPQCTYSGCNGNQYDQRPTMEYNNPQYSAIPAGNLYNAPQKHQYHAAAPVYSQPTYNTPNHNTPNYDTPSYKAPSYSAPSYNVPTYNVPNYGAASYNVPTYNTPSYNAPNYNVPHYNAPSYNAPSYNAPSYNAPSYQPPVYNTNSNYPSAPAYPSSSNFYPHPHEPYHSPLPSNLLVGCHPHVSMVHDTGYTSPFYNSPHYNQLPHHNQPPHHNPPSYHHHSPDDSPVSPTKGYDFSSREMMPETETQMDNSPSNTKTAPVKDNSAKSTAKNEKNDTIQSANTFEEAKMQQADTLFKMAQYQNQLSQGKNKAPTEEKPKTESAAPGKKIK